MKKIKLLLLVLTMMGFAACILVCISRLSLEQQNRVVELTCDYDELRQLSGNYGHSFQEVLEQLKASGVNSIALNEQTLRTLAIAGDILVLNKKELDIWTQNNSVKTPLEEGYIYLLLDDNELFKELLLFLKVKLGGERVVNANSGKIAGKYGIIAVNIAERNILENIGLGFSEKKLKNIAAAGLKVVLRPINDVFVSPESINCIFSSINDFRNVSGMIFNGQEALGYPDYMQNVQEWLQRENIKLGVIEFSRQEGIKEFKKNIVMVHSIKNEELKKEDSGTLIYRFRRAALERNARLLFVHFNEEQARKNTIYSYVSDIRVSLKSGGLSSGISTSLPTKYNPITPFMNLITGMGLISILIIMISACREVPAVKVLIFLGLAAFIIILSGNNPFIEQFLALIAALVFPVLAVKSALDEKRRLSVVKQYARNVPQLFITFIIFSLITLYSFIAVVFITGLLSNWDYMMKIQQFRGIKLALLLPPVIVLFVVYKPKELYENIMLKTVRVKDILIMLVALFAVYFMLSRSGNDSSLIAGNREYLIREFLEKIFYVRPRFKEFLIGHPFMLLGIFLWMEKLKGKGALPAAGYCKIFIIIGLVGQISIINTFCHIHTPLIISLIRTLNGLWIGSLLGIILITLIKLIKRQRV